VDRIESLTRKLGEAIAAHERCVRLREASRAFKADAEAQKLREEYDAVVTKVQEKLRKGLALEPEEKRAEGDLRARVAASATIQALLRAQADFQQLMHEVQATLQAALDL